MTSLEDSEIHKGTSVRRKLLSIVVVAVLLGGCKSSESPIFFTSPASPYPDVPVPASFNLVSESTPGGALVDSRMMEHVYRSTDDIQPIVQYFSDQLPRKGWMLQAQSHDTGRSVMKYTKGGEELLIELGKGAGLSTNARVKISPAGVRGPSSP
jgi:hypothetical protein